MAPGTAAVAAVNAGTDITLVARTDAASTAVHEELVRAVADHRLPRTTLEHSYRRILELKQSLGR